MQIPYVSYFLCKDISGPRDFSYRIMHQFGIPLPLCSCGVLPTAVSLRRQGASKAASTSFLIATPQTGIDSIAATYSLLGLPFALIRPVAALVGAIAGGILEKNVLKNLHGIQKVHTFASLFKTTRGVAQLVRVRVWGA